MTGFSRFDSPRQTTQKSKKSRSRASTIQGTPVPDILLQTDYETSPEKERRSGEDIFVQNDEVDALGGTEEPDAEMPQSFEDLPIEIRSLTERFLESLSAKVHPTPLSIDALSILFQDFYIRAEAHIATHIAALSSRISRDKSPAPSASSKGSRGNGKSGTATPSRNRSSSDAANQEQQMVSASEILDKRKARRILELKRIALEEAVERAVCEKLYPKLYRHRSTDDEERDQKLRSRVAALSLVGIGLKELLVTGTSEDLSEEVQKQVSDDEEQIKAWLGPTRESLMKMNEAEYPAAKLAHLTVAHKGIVETLGKMFPASSSADEVLPTLIYALMTTPPSEINAISNLNFIQRFRATNKLDGESAYCLVNLEAAISFLETVDLPSLRKGELPQGPDKSGRPITPLVSHAPMQLGITPADDVVSTPDSEGRSISPRPLPSPSKPNSRRLSTLTQTFQSGSAKIEAAGDSFRGAVLDGADQAFDAINNTFENSFRFMFGKVKEQQSKRSGGLVEMPKTLEDARKLVSPTIPSEEIFSGDIHGDEASVSAASDQPEDSRSDLGVTSIDPLNTRPLDMNSKVLDLIGGRRQIRDRSVDSSRSGGSAAGKKVAFLDTTGGVTSSPAPIASPGNPALEGIRGIGNSLNPFNRISGVGGLFGRRDSASPGHSPQPSTTSFTPGAEKEKAATLPADVAAVPLKKLAASGGSGKRFLDMKDAKDMKIGEVEELLKAYQGLVASVRSVVDT
ncbi:hypothetical protein NA57DRAFT_41928 [Rhizodiscina lignyota]|uniref:VPS9 domain-containing protein n=1 Tax=Rhizodiscina lignyota TaxID=1504668 RepID=A0A9P4IDC5_9PEZI|nr:hypothetical protein NA57DRAFT_41928 [Rhizodiscina lignyota]